MIKDIITSLPKVDLHRHIQGAIRPKTIMELADKNNISLPVNTLDELIPLVQVQGITRSLDEFLEKFIILGKIIQTEDDIVRISYEMVEDAALDNVKIIEVRYCPESMSFGKKINYMAVTAAVKEGIEKAKQKYDILAPMIIIISRFKREKTPTEMAELAVRDIVKGVVGLDIAGPEANWVIDEEFEKACHIAKQGGLKLTVHAGEAGGPENVEAAITRLKADRIGHGVRVIKSQETMEILKNKKIPLELCITSNIQTQAVKGIEDHPAKKLFDQGILITLNTDDPSISGITLSDELFLANNSLGFTVEEIKEVIANGVNNAFISQGERKKIIAKYFPWMKSL